MESKRVVMMVIAALAPSFAAAEMGYRDKISTIEAQIELVNKQADLQNALLKSGGASASLPKVLSLMGTSEDAQATLYYSTGRIRTVKVGDVLAPNVKITSISQAGVQARGKNGPMVLAFHNPAITGDAANADAINIPSAPSVKAPSIPLPVSAPAPSNVPAPSAQGMQVPVPQPAG